MPGGIPVFLDGEAESTPLVIQSLLGFQHQVIAQASYAIGAQTWDFDCWSDGGAAAHGFTAAQGGISLMASYAPTLASGSCALACGFSSFGLGASSVNHLGLVGTGSPGLGGTAEIVTTDLGGDAPGAWILVCAGSASFPLLGGVGWIDPGQVIARAFRPNLFGQATWTVAIPSTSGLAAIDAGQPQGFALSSGLELEICP